MNQKTLLVTLLVSMVIFGVYASNFEHIHKKAQSPGLIQCADNAKIFPVNFITQILVLGILSVILAFFYIRKLWPYRYGLDNDKQTKFDGWRFLMPCLWMILVFGYSMGVIRITKFAGCPAVSMGRNFANLLMNKLPYISWLAPMLIGVVAIFAIYFAVGSLFRIISRIGVYR